MGMCVFVHLFWLGFWIGWLSESVYERFGTQTPWKLKRPNALVLPEPQQLAWNLCLTSQMLTLGTLHLESLMLKINNLRPFRNTSGTSSIFQTSRVWHCPLSCVCGRFFAVVPGCVASLVPPLFWMWITKSSCWFCKLSVVLLVNHFLSQSLLFSIHTLYSYRILSQSSLGHLF